MSNVICLSSIQQSSTEQIYVCASDVNISNLFSIDRVIRQTCKEKKNSCSKDISDGLVLAGYTVVENINDLTVTPFFRAWDEYRMKAGESFLVGFKADAAHELQNKIILATPYPVFYAAISPDYEGGSEGVLLINEAHEPMYPNDLVWKDIEQTEKIPMCEMYLFKEQFPSDFEYLAAKASLVASGYSVGERSPVQH